jgi:hypothetical protein
VPVGYRSEQHFLILPFEGSSFEAPFGLKKKKRKKKKEKREKRKEAEGRGRGTSRLVPPCTKQKGNFGINNQDQ